MEGNFLHDGIVAFIIWRAGGVGTSTHPVISNCAYALTQPYFMLFHFYPRLLIFYYIHITVESRAYKTLAAMTIDLI